jgi:hypothetical protein
MPKAENRACPRCWGHDPKCTMCPQLNQIEATKKKETADKKRQVWLRRRFLAEIWIKARKYLLDTLNAPEKYLAEYRLNPKAAADLLQEVKTEFGPWQDYVRERMPIPPEVEKLLKSPF